MIIKVESYIPFHERILQENIFDIGKCLEINETIKIDKLKIVEPPLAVINFLKHDLTPDRSFRPKYKYLYSICDIDINIDRLKEWNPCTYDDISPIKNAVYIVSSIFGEILQLSDLAFPGAIDTCTGISIVENNSVEYIKEKRSIPLIVGNDETWPILKTIDIMTCVNWAYRVGFGYENFARKTNRVGRMLAAFTHLPHNGEGEILFRAMQGLEAFYSDGIGDLRRQLSDKSSLFLGKWKENKNIVGKLYDSRSKFIHGSSVIGYFNHDLNDHDESAEELSNATYFSVRLLVSTIQKCIVENIFDIIWSYNYETVKHPVYDSD